MNTAPAVLFVASEVVPFSKTGGLADVAGALPSALAAQGCRVTVVSPFYRDVEAAGYATRRLPGPVTVRAGSCDHAVCMRELTDPGPSVRHVFVESAPLFGRAGIYSDPADDRPGYEDNDERFSVFCRAVLAWIRASGEVPDIIHLNDWQAALMAAYLTHSYHDDPLMSRVRTLLTVHNLAYQGTFPAERFACLGFDETLFGPMSPFEFYGQVNFLKAGLHYTHKINTVSPTYAREIQTDDELGCGLRGVLQARRRDLTGILNGIDTTIWNPAADSLIATTYDVSSVAAGKTANKDVLCDMMGVPRRRRRCPLVGLISRLADQKGFDLISDAAGRLFSLDINVILLGTGDPKLHLMFEKLEKRFAGRLKAVLTFDNTMAHQIEAGADMFLMPSRYEPCGLNQMYSLAYGAVPIVRATGGLADTVIDADQAPDDGTGFVFEEYTADAMLDAIGRAVRAYDRADRWNAIRARGMRCDFSWAQSAARYFDLYKELLTVDVSAAIRHH